ncbi:MAG: hypothetical protein JSV25_00190 [Spirochaetota bacterium]|nr:MAG: hypothetical protein JSV25_00190 [Spirochaetota bacterium]
MKRLSVMLIIIFTILCVSSLCLFAQEYDFRNTRWGMTAKEVRGIEKEKLVSRSGDKKVYKLVYGTSLAGYKGSIVYYFTEYKLRNATYSFDIAESGKAIEDYRYFKKLLTEKYGAPESSKKEYSDQKKRELGPLHYVLLLPLNFRVKEGLESGALVLKSGWSTDFTYITLFLAWNSKKELFTLDINYAHKRWVDDQKRDEEERKKIEEEELLDAI